MNEEPVYCYTVADDNALHERIQALHAEANELQERLDRLRRQNRQGDIKFAAQLTLTDQLWMDVERVYEAEGAEAASARFRVLAPYRPHTVDLIGFGDAGTQCLRVMHLFSPDPDDRSFDSSDEARA